MKQIAILLFCFLYIQSFGDSISKDQKDLNYAGDSKEYHKIEFLNKIKNK